MIKRKLSIILTIWLLSGICCFVNNPASAEGLCFGKLDITPALTLKQIHDDNIFLDERNETSDWITSVSPAIFLDLAVPANGGIRLGYQGGLNYYNDHDENDWESHKGLFDFNYQSPGGLILGVLNTYVDTEDPYGSDNEYKLGVPQISRWSNTLRAKAGYAFSNRFRVLTFYNFYKQDYDLREDFTQDYETNEWGAGFQMKLLPKTWGFVRYHFGERDYYTHPSGTGVNRYNDADFDWTRVNAGLTWDSAAKLSGEVNFGYMWKDYDNSLDVNGSPYRELNTWIASTRILFEAGPTTTCTLVIERASRDSGANTNEFFVDTGAGLSLRQVFLKKFFVTAGASYSQNDYRNWRNGSRDDDNYRGNIDIDYRVREWLSAGLGYDFRKKDSNEKVYEYTDHRFLVSFRVMY